MTVAALATGCMLPQQVGTVQHPSEVPAEVVWERDLPVVGNPAVTENVAVVYTADDDGALTLIGLSTLDGSTDRKSTRLNSSHVAISYAVFCLKKKKT